MTFEWKCPYCNHTTTIVNSNVREHTYDMTVESSLGGSVQFYSQFIICPNSNCKKLTLSCRLHESKYDSSWNQYRKGKILYNWSLLPKSNSRVFPDYIPASIRQDYEEACLIRNDSPKASATLSRRCLQGIIRDFWGVIKPRLVDEINAIKDRIDPLVWQSIDAVRKVGNIGAHMEKDINIIVDVDPEEAGMLIQLIELLFEEWYIHRHERELKLNSIVALSLKKVEEKKV